MIEVAGMVGNLVKSKEFRPPETVTLMSQRELRQLPLVEVCAVDPANAHEVDDAFSVTKRPGHSTEVSVVIAYGAAISYLTPEFQEALETGWSLYPAEGVYTPMISNEALVTHELSLVEGELRAGLELSFQLNRGGKTMNRTIRKVAARTTQKSYQQYGEELVAGDHTATLGAVDAIRRFRGMKGNISPQRYIDMYRGDVFRPEESLARKIVQELMVQFNKEMGREASKRRLPYPRRYTDYVSVDEILDTGIENMHDGIAIEEQRIKRAFYSPQPRLHEDLGTDNYTHTSSPLRRQMDLLGHNIWDLILRGARPEDINHKAISRNIEHINHLITQRSVKIGRDF